MGSATRSALAASREALDALGTQVTVTTGEQLLNAGRVIGDSAQLRGLLANPATGAADSSAIIASVFGSFDESTRTVLTTAATATWSSPDEFVAGLEELGLRALAVSAPVNSTVEQELFSFAAAVSSDDELELALGNKLGAGDPKLALIDTLLGSNASAQSRAIVRHVVQQPRGRSLRQSLATAAAIIADVADKSIATVTTAVPLAPAQLTRLESALAARYGRAVRINTTVDPALLAGIRVQIGDDVIDGSVASKLNELRLQLAG